MSYLNINQMDNDFLKKRLKQSYNAVSELYGVDYADNHPELIVACMNSLAYNELSTQIAGINESINSLKESMKSITITLENKLQM